VGLYAVPQSRPFLVQWWWQIALGIQVVVAGLLIWFKRKSTAKRTAIFLVSPLIILAIEAIAFLPEENQIRVLRLVFLAVVCLFPALIYCLFIITRKNGLLNDYFLNLKRLGLLKHQHRHTGAAAQHATKCQVLNYVQKFEALYGPLPKKLVDEIIRDPLAALAKIGSRVQRPCMEELFNLHTGIPVFLATILITVGWVLALPPNGTADQHPLWSVIFSVNEDPIIYAFLGAYFFSLQMLFRRFVRKDLRKCAYLSVSLRIVLAVIGTWAVMTAVKTAGYTDSSHLAFPLLGFVIGVFPRVAWQIIQGVAQGLMKRSKFASWVSPSIESRLPLSDLDGLTVWHESRLEEEDIENIPNMASGDIIDLMISTRFSPDLIIDWVDQAILFTHLGPDQEKDRKDQGKGSSRRRFLRLQGIFTATSLIQAFKQAQSRSEADKLKEILNEGLKGQSGTLMDAMKTEPNFDLICAWRGIHKADSRPKPRPRRRNSKPNVKANPGATQTIARKVTSSVITRGIPSCQRQANTATRTCWTSSTKLAIAQAELETKKVA
jgi:hypothetical protein